MRQKLSEEIDSMLKLGVIEPSTAPYASPIVIVNKSGVDKAIRVCCDNRMINKITVFDPEPMPTAEEIFSELNSCQYFSKFNLAKGYWQVPMKSEFDEDVTTITTHRGLYRFLVMPFGLSNSPATFSRIMRRFLANSHNLCKYLDEVLTPTKDWQTQMSALRDLFTRARQGKLSIRSSKCSVGYASLSFLGFNVNCLVLQPTKQNVDKILKAPRPITKTQLRSFIGLISFYQQFVPNFSAIAVPLADLTKKGSPNVLIWNTAQKLAFCSLRDCVAKQLILRLPNYNISMILPTDASQNGLGSTSFTRGRWCETPYLIC